MLSKLLKYECKTTWGTLYPIALGVLGISALLAVLNSVANSIPVVTEYWPFMTLRALVGFVFGLGLFAAMLACAFVLINRFYRLLGDEGYLMLSLPATAFEQIAAKLICAVITTLLAICVAGISGFLVSEMDMNFSLPGFEGDVLGSVLGTIYFGLVALLLMAGGFLFVYLCIAIAGHWPQQRLLASIGTYFVLTFLLQIVFFAVVMVGMVGIVQGGQNIHIEINGDSGPALLSSAAIVFALLIAGFDAILWAVTQNLMTKHLNLP